MSEQEKLHEIDSISRLIQSLARRHYDHPDPVAKLYGALSDVDDAVGKIMLNERIKQEGQSG